MGGADAFALADGECAAVGTHGHPDGNADAIKAGDFGHAHDAQARKMRAQPVHGFVRINQSCRRRFTRAESRTKVCFVCRQPVRNRNPGQWFHCHSIRPQITHPLQTIRNAGQRACNRFNLFRRGSAEDIRSDGLLRYHWPQPRKPGPMDRCGHRHGRRPAPTDRCARVTTENAPVRWIAAGIMTTGLLSGTIRCFVRSHVPTNLLRAGPKMPGPTASAARRYHT